MHGKTYFQNNGLKAIEPTATVRLFKDTALVYKTCNQIMVDNSSSEYRENDHQKNNNKIENQGERETHT